jgi:hypothetical protein
MGWLCLAAYFVSETIKGITVKFGMSHTLYRVHIELHQSSKKKAHCTEKKKLSNNKI